MKPKKSQLMKDVDYHIKEGENLRKIRLVIGCLKLIDKCKAKIAEAEKMIKELENA